MTGYLEDLRQRGDLAELSFPAVEYARRQAVAVAAMERRGLDLVLLNHLPSLCYLSGYQTPATSDYNALFLSRSGAVALQVIEHEIPNAVLTGCIADVRGFRWYLPEEVPQQTVAIVRDLAGDGSRLVIGLEMQRPGMTLGIFDSLKRAFPDATFVDASDLLDAQRVIKSPAEIAYLRRSGALSVKGAEAGLDAWRPGCIDNDIAAAVYRAMIEGGSEYVPTQPFIATGARSGMVHTTFKRRPILAGEAVFVEAASSVQRYTAPVMRSGFVGPRPSLIDRLRAGVMETIDLLLANIAPGRTAHEVARAASAGFRPIRDEIYFQGAYGYHVGLSLPPAWWEGLFPYIAEGIDAELRPGMVFHMPVAARIPGECGVALSETVLVTDTGCEPLTAATRSFRDFAA